MTKREWLDIHEDESFINIQTINNFTQKYLKTLILYNEKIV